MPTEAERSEDRHGDPGGGGFCPILRPGSSHVARPETHVWVHTKSAPRGAAARPRIKDPANLGRSWRRLPTPPDPEEKKDSL